VPPRKLRFELIAGFKVGRRAIGFLVDENDTKPNAKVIFESLEGETRRLVRTRMDSWLDGMKYDKAYHGFPNETKHKDCFVFRWAENRVEQRIYGFLCHPKPKSDRGFQLCVLVVHVTKNEWESDQSIKDWMMALRKAPEVIKAIQKIYPEYGREDEWLN
jgi:hypothetical protein